MVVGKELEHLRAMVRMADYRGTDVRLMTGEPLRESRLQAPYPAFRWKWKTQLSWAWRMEQHINILEMQAFLTHLRHRARVTGTFGQRFLHILDSRVSCGVIAKGRSSSRRLNRVARRIAALALAYDNSPLTLWTISKWNFSDFASRVHEPKR